MSCIREGNYETGMIARSLVGELSRMVAVLASSLGSPFQMMAFRGIGEVLEKHRYHTLFHSVRPEDQDDPDTLASLRAYRPAGYIVLRGAEGLRGVHAKTIFDEGVPLVGQGKLEGVDTHTVQFDDRAAMRIATDYVIESGHRRLGHLGGPVFSGGAKERKLGFIESLIKHDIPVSDALIIDAGETAAAGYRAALEMLESPAGRPTALVCFNDMVAMGVYRAAHELSLQIPEDVSVVGFDGIDFAELLGPPLTTVDIFPQVLGQKCAELLMQVISDQTGRGIVTEHVTPQLVERASVRTM